MAAQTQPPNALRPADEVLVLGYGNELRGDDAVGPRAARAVAAWQMPGVRALALPQLTPELAEPIAAARAVVFVDAAPGLAGGPVQVSTVTPAASAASHSHASDPARLLALARTLFGRCPSARLVAVPAADFDLGERLSPLAERGLAAALEALRKLLLTLAGGGAERLKASVRGAVQGVGFRPFVFRLARELGLTGWVTNSAQGVFLEVEGRRAVLEQFLLRLEAERPPRSFIQSLEATWLDPVGHQAFEIRPSLESGAKTALVLPDIATCPECLREIFDPANRRYRYPFTNCTHCGPRFSIIEALPYDRARTSMKRFTMCPQCQAEYHDPANRRFHAQPNACPACGPHLELWAPAGRVLAARDQALKAAAAALRDGQVVAVKGLGGFHLVVDARHEDAVRRLRQRKHREEKPLALMFPALETVRACCEVSELEARLLRSPEAPIVLLRRLAASGLQPLASGPPLAPSVAPHNPYLGVMLPYTPLHHLLLAELGFPVVATSGNLSDEPICTDEREALQRLAGLADLFLVHDRPIVRHVDDSVARILLGRELVLRRARGYAPLPIRLRGSLAAELEPQPQNGPPLPLPGGEGRGEGGAAGPTPAGQLLSLLAVGAHLKNTVALAVGPQVFLSQHIGDLDTVESFAAFQRVVADLPQLYQARPALVACDLHPDYLSTGFARQAGLPVVAVQHHYAHALACLAENELEPPALGVSWDGTGYGPDGTVWGGEFLLIHPDGFERVAGLRPFRLPGGEQAVKEPRRAALGLLFEALGPRAFERTDLAPVRSFSAAERTTLRAMLERGLNAPLTSSAGRLFDAVAALTGLRQQSRFEGQAAMELEFALEGVQTDEAYPWRLSEAAGPRPEAGDRLSGPAARSSQQMFWLDWAPLLEALLADLARQTPAGLMAARFHNALAEAIVTVARRVGEPRVVLSGGCFQNRYLTARTVERLRAAGFQPYWHQRVPPNDGGIALGQIVAALRARAVRPGPAAKAG